MSISLMPPIEEAIDGMYKKRRGNKMIQYTGVRRALQKISLLLLNVLMFYAVDFVKSTLSKPQAVIQNRGAFTADVGSTRDGTVATVRNTPITTTQPGNTIEQLIREAEDNLRLGEVDKASVAIGIATKIYSSTLTRDLNESPAIEIAKSRLLLISGREQEACRTAEESLQRTSERYGPNSVPALEVGIQLAECYFGSHQYSPSLKICDVVEKSVGYQQVNLYARQSVELCKIRNLIARGGASDANSLLAPLIRSLRMQTNPGLGLLPEALRVHAMLIHGLGKDGLDLARAEISESMRLATSASEKMEAAVVAAQIYNDAGNTLEAQRVLYDSFSDDSTGLKDTSSLTFSRHLLLADAATRNGVTSLSVEIALGECRKAMLVRHQLEDDAVLHSQMAWLYIAKYKISADVKALETAEDEFETSCKDADDTKMQLVQRTAEFIFACGYQLANIESEDHRFQQSLGICERVQKLFDGANDVKGSDCFVAQIQLSAAICDADLSKFTDARRIVDHVRSLRLDPPCDARIKRLAEFVIRECDRLSSTAPN